jgi:mannose-1-phosphate guanylyltransferase
MQTNNPHPDRSLHAIVLAAGAGRRLRSFIRQSLGTQAPKQFCSFDGEQSLLQQTLTRLRPLLPATQIQVIVDQSYSSLAAVQLRDHAGCVRVDQPCNRGTAAGTLLPLLRLYSEAPGALVLLTAADHGVLNPTLFRRSIEVARQAVSLDPSQIILFGADPEGPSVDYGWITLGSEVEQPGGFAIHRVEQFVEKPEPQRAQSLFSDGRSCWSTMVLVARADTLLEQFRRSTPALVRQFANPRWSGEELYRRIPAVDFSADVLATADDLRVLRWPRALGWTDLGTADRMMQWLAQTRAIERQCAPEDLSQVL